MCGNGERSLGFWSQILSSQLQCEKIAYSTPIEQVFAHFITQQKCKIRNLAWMTLFRAQGCFFKLMSPIDSCITEDSLRAHESIRKMLICTQYKSSSLTVLLPELVSKYLHALYSDKRASNFQKRTIICWKVKIKHLTMTTMTAFKKFEVERKNDSAVWQSSQGLKLWSPHGMVI